MKLIKMTVTPKQYNGISYNEFTLFLQDGNFKRLVSCTGKLAVFLVDPSDNREVDVGKLDECYDSMIPAGSIVDFWFDLSGKVSRLDVHCPANVAGSDIPIS